MSDAVAIVGAGAAGCATAYALRDAAVDVTVFEADEAVGGRAATRRHHGRTYEVGANYLPGDDERVEALVTDELPSEGLVTIDPPIWTFDAAGSVSAGRTDQATRWTYEAGLDEVCRRLLAASDATVRRGARIDGLVRDGERWRLELEDGESSRDFAAVVPTPPAPATADLLGGSEWDHRDRRDLREAVAGISYRTVVSAVLHYPFEVDVPYYALVAAGDTGGDGDDTDGDEPHRDVGWIGREECKPGRVPDGESLLLVQLSPAWSAAHHDDEDATIVERAAEGAAGLLGDDRLQEPDWTDVARWRYALPDDGLPDAALGTAREHDLYFAGDWVAGEARLYAALRSGLTAGERIRAGLA